MEQGVRRGGSGIGAFILLLILVIAIVGWPRFIDARGSTAQGTIQEKRENIRTEGGEWFRGYQILAAFRMPGYPLERRAICDVPEKTFDELRLGNTVAVHYLANVPNQPFVSNTHLEPCTTMASFSLNPYIAHNLEVVGLMLLGILVLWRVFRIRAAVTLLIPWLLYTYAVIGLPRAEPELKNPVETTATIERVETITTILDTPEEEGVRLERPFQLVTFQYVPKDRDTPVKGVDKVDVNSLPDLKPGAPVKIQYETGEVRTARLLGGTRTFVGESRRYFFWICLALIVGSVIVGIFEWFFGLFGRAARATHIARNLGASGRRVRRL